ncbi:MAG: insulinase family protein [Myxococcales bacterium]|nr:insulinase family protein [Myxococcales bacterium]
MIDAIAGTRVVTAAASDAPLVWIDVAIAGGASADPVGLEGLHRHAALLARRGAGARDRAAFDDALDSLGAAIEVSIGRDAVTLSALCLTRNLEPVVALMADVLAAPRFADDEHARLMRETPQVLDEVRDDDGALATRWFDHEVCPGHPYARTALGTEASLAALGRAAAQALWRREVVAANLIIGIAGDVDGVTAQRIAAQLVAGLPAQPAPTPIAFTAGTGGREPRLIVVDKADRTQAQLRFGHLGPRFGDDDTAAMLALETGFGGMFSARLMQEIRVKRGWSYGAGCALRRSRQPHWFELWMATGIDVAGPACRLTHDLFAALAEDGLTEAELALARSYLVGSLPFHLATARQRMQLAMRDALFGLPVGYTAELPARVAQLSVDEVRAAARRHLHPERLVTVAVTTAATARAGLVAAAIGAPREVEFDAY